MKQQRFSFPSLSSPVLPPAAMSTTLIIYAVLCVGLAYLMLLSPLLGLIGAIVINLIVLFFLRSWLALPLYILVAGPSVALSLSSSGILSRLYIGDVLFVLIVGIWILKTVLPERKSGRSLIEPHLLAPFLALILVGLTSIIYSRLFPDPTVAYTYPNAHVSLTIVNLAEMALLIGLPMFVVVIPGLVRSARDVYWIIGAYLAIGILYALGTIFASQLGLLSKEVILGIRRPEVFGSVSSGLGTILVLFTSIAFGQTLYTTKTTARVCWGLLTLVFSIAVIMTFGREAWIGLFLAVLVMVGLRTKNWSVLLVPLVGLLILLIPGVSNFFDPTKVYGVDRFKMWADAIAIWQRSPYMGVGAGNYQFFDRTYGTDIAGVAHNQYLQVLAEMGVQGLLCLIWIMIVMGLLVFNRFKSATTNLGKALALAYIGFYVSLVFGGFFTGVFIPSAAAGGGTAPFVESSYRWLLLGIVLTIPNWEKAVKPSEERLVPTGKEVEGALQAQIEKKSEINRRVPTARQSPDA